LIPALLRRCLAEWIKRRQGADFFPVVIHRRRLYILPTRAGTALAALLLVMLVAGLNYTNSYALFLTFLLAGFAVVTMHQCHRNLLQVSLEGAIPSATFAGEPARLQLLIGNDTKLPRLEIDAGALGHSAGADLEAYSKQRVEISIPTSKRGVIRIERIRLATVYPFGLFRAWGWAHLPVEIIVYPRPHGSLPMPGRSGTRQGLRSRLNAGTEEWLGLRPFRDGDSPRQVDWKAYARGSALLVKEYASAGSELYEFDFAQLAQLELEARLEQLARWIVDAEARGEQYGLVLPSQRLEADRGPEHRHRCLAALAAYGLETER
jgi:uncharacterized protein (DUF58 family)